MKRNLSVAWLGVAALACAVPAMGSVVVDGYTWDAAYTGDALPTASTPTWTTGGGGSASVSGGELTIDTTAADDRYYEILDGGAWNPNSSDVAYVQFRAKVNSQVDGYRMAGGIFIGGEGKGQNFTLGTYNGKTGVFNISQANIAEVDVSQYHTYRVAFNPSGTTYALWIDDMSPANYVSSGSLDAGSSMYFGDGGGDYLGSMTWDYIAWNNASAPAAVPEPAALGLLAMGGLAMVRRRRA